MINSCQHPGCDRNFEGGPDDHYCELHQGGPVLAEDLLGDFTEGGMWVSLGNGARMKKAHLCGGDLDG